MKRVGPRVSTRPLMPTLVDFPDKDKRRCVHGGLRGAWVEGRDSLCEVLETDA
jgi:hypothetical protein